MEIKGIKVNTMFVERMGEEIVLYGSHFDQKRQHLTVFQSTKNIGSLGEQIFGEGYTNEYLREKLGERPRHNFIGRVSKPISSPISMKRVTFVD